MPESFPRLASRTAALIGGLLLSAAVFAQNAFPAKPVTLMVPYPAGGVSDVIARLSEPLLRPVRRVLPLVGGVDLSPLVVLVLVQVALMALGHLQFGPLR